MEKKDLVIAIDGPAASGKSTVAGRLADMLGIAYVSTGSLYRALAWALNAAGKADPDKEFFDSVKLEYLQNGDHFEPCVNGTFPGDALRSAAVAAKASAIATIPAVRDFLLELQRSFAGEKLIVMEGRDIGTVIFPNAKYKFYITASAEARARRRFAQKGEVESGASFEELVKSINDRDWQDSHRSIAPLRQAEDAFFIDSSNLSIDEVVAQVLAVMKGKGF